MESMLLFFFFFLACISLYLLFKPNHDDPTNNPTTNGGLRAYPFVGHLPIYLRNRGRMLDWQTEAVAAAPTNTIVFRRFGNIRGVVTANPAVVEHMLKTHFDNYPKGPRFVKTLEDFLGRGIFNSDGELWRAQRKTASFEFNTRSLRNFVVRTVHHEIVDRFLPLLVKASAEGKVIDLQDVLERLAFDNICKVSFGVDPMSLASGEVEESSSRDAGRQLAAGFAEAFSDATNLSAGRFRYAIPGFWRLKKLLNIGSERRLKESIGIVHEFAMPIIRTRKKELQEAAPRTDDLLSRFIAAAGDELDELFLRDIVISFILAGRDTTSSALTWFFWLLSTRPKIESKILQEIQNVRSRRASHGESSEERFDFEELREMQYLHAAITESMRLYPPVPANSAYCQNDDMLPDGTPTKRGWFMSYNSYAMGRMESIWGEDCKEYRPERWIDEQGTFKGESPFKFPAFNGGPRMCLGKEMAYIQMKSIAANVLERFSVEVEDPNKRPHKVMSLTLRMQGGLPVRIHERALITSTPMKI